MGLSPEIPKKPEEESNSEITEILKRLTAVGKKAEQIRAAKPETNPMAVVLASSGPQKEKYTRIPILSLFNGGLFYLTPQPSKPPFVQEGDRVDEGQILCLTEIFKMYNEIISPVAGIVQKIFLENEAPISYANQLMMIITPDNPEDPRIVTISVDGQINEEEKKAKEAKEKLFIYSHYVGHIAGLEDHKKPFLLKVGDIIQPDEPVAYMIVLRKACAICFQGKKPAQIVEVFVQIHDTV